MDDAFTILIGWGLGALVEFFIQPIYAWLLMEYYHLMEMNSVIHPVRPWYTPVKVTLKDLNFYDNINFELLFDLPYNLSRYLTEVGELYYRFAPTIQKSPFSGTGKKSPKLVFGIDSIGVYREIFEKGNTEPLSLYHSSPAGLKGMSSLRTFRFPKNPIYHTLAPHIGTHSGFWDNTSKQGRGVFYFTPLVPFLILKPAFMFLPNTRLAWKMPLLFLFLGPFKPVPPAATGRGRPDWWEEVVGGGVSPLARSLTYNYVNLILGWCGKLFISVVGTGAKTRPPMPAMLKKILEKFGPLYKLAYKAIKFIIPMTMGNWEEVYPIEPFHPVEVFCEAKGVGSPTWAGIPKPTRQIGVVIPSWASFGLGQASLIFSTTGRLFAEHPSVLACPGKMNDTITVCQEEPTYFIDHILWLPSPNIDILVEDDCGTVILATEHGGNEDGAKLAMVRWAPRILPIISAGGWIEFAHLWKNAMDALDDILDDVFDKLEDFLTSDKYAPYSHAMCSSVYGMHCYEAALKHTISSYKEVSATLKNGIADDVLSGAARMSAFLTLFISLYLGGGPPGVLLFWWAPQTGTPVWVSRSVCLCSFSPIAIGKGVLERFLTLPSELHEKFEDMYSEVRGYLNKLAGVVGGKKSNV